MRGESSLGGRSAAALRQILKPRTCLIRTDSGFRRCLGSCSTQFLDEGGLPPSQAVRVVKSGIMGSMKIIRNIVILLALSSVALATSACPEKKGPFEKAGEKVDKAVDKTKDAAKDATK